MNSSRAVSDIARRFGVAPRIISDLFYQRVLDDNACPIVGGRRLVPDSYLAEIERILRKLDLIKNTNFGEDVL